MANDVSPSGADRFEFLQATSVAGTFASNSGSTLPHGNLIPDYQTDNVAVAFEHLIATVDSLADSGPGSLRQALLDANASPSATTIRFNFTGTGVHTIALQSPLAEFTTPVILDGSTQPGYDGQPLIELDGSNAGADAIGLRISGGESIVRGLIINRFDGGGIDLTGGSNNLVAGNFVGVNANGAQAQGNGRYGIRVIDSAANQIGGSQPADRNIFSGNNSGGVRIEGMASRQNQIQGNYVGTDATGTLSIPNGSGILCYNAPEIQLGGSQPGQGNVVSGNNWTGISLSGNFCVDAVVQGNLIGVDASGSAPLPNRRYGIQVNGGAREALIGGPHPGAGNVISGNGIPSDRNAPGYGIMLQTIKTVVQGNNIGADATGQRPLGNKASGVYLVSGDQNKLLDNIIVDNGVGIYASDTDDSFTRRNPETNLLISGNFVGADATGKLDLGNRNVGIYVGRDVTALIGGTDSEAGNQVAFNDHDGVQVFTGARAQILGNSIWSNLYQGIRLLAFNPVVNDIGDADTGANGLQNRPELSAVSRVGGVTTIQGVLRSKLNNNYRVEFFATRECDDDGHGEGERFLGLINVVTDDAGDANLTAAFSVAAPRGWQITATATALDTLETSDFSACLALPPLAWDGGGDGVSWSDPANWSPDEAPQADDAVEFPSAGELTVNLGGGVTTVGRLNLGAGSTRQKLNLGGGSLTIGNGSMIGANGVINLQAGTLNTGGMLTLEGGMIEGNGTVNGMVVNNGMIAPGNSPGSIVIQGDYVQMPGGTLDMEIGGLLPGVLHDRLTVTGAATLAGTLNLSRVNQFQASATDLFQIISAGSRTGEFDDITGSRANNGPLVFKANYPANGLNLTVIDATPSFQPATLTVQGDVFQAAMLGAGGQSYIIEASSDLVHWTQIHSGSIANDSLSFTDPQGQGAPARFYRARLQD